LPYPAPSNGTNFAFTNDDDCNCDKSADRMILPTQSFTGYADVILTHDIFHNNTAGDILTCEVSTDGGTTWTLVNTYAATAGSWSNGLTVALTAYAGMPAVTISFVYNDAASWGYGCGVDDIQLEGFSAPIVDVAMTTTNAEYTLIPLSQAGSPIGSTGMIYNIGAVDVTNATMTVNIFDGLAANVYSGSSTPGAILAGDSLAASVAGYTPLAVDVYTVEQVVTITEADVNIMNDTSYYTVAVTDSTFARDNGTVISLLGVGTGSTANIGQLYAMPNADTMTSVSFFFAPGTDALGDTVRVAIFDVAGGLPTTQIGQSAEHVLGVADTVAAGNFLTLSVTDMLSAPLVLAAGTYYVAVQEYDNMANMALALSGQIYTPGAALINISGGAYATSESFGFPGAYIIRPNYGPGPICLESTSTINASSCAVYTAPSGATYATTGMYMDTIPNYCGADSVITINLTIGANSTATVNVTECVSYTAPSGAVYTTTGMYMDTIANSCAGDSIITINLTVPVLDLSVSNVGATITAGASGSTYQWIDCATLSPVAGETGQSFTATADGSYAVIVTTSGCSDTSACTAVTVGLNELLANDLLEVYPNPSNGEFTVGVQGLVANEVIIEVLDFSGRVVGTRKFNNVNGQLTASMNVNVDAGSYLVRVTANGESATKTVVISK